MVEEKVFVLGIDGAPPKYVLDLWLDDLPNIKKLMENGCYALSNSCIPPSTCVAWNVMASGKDPSSVGVFGYTKRIGFDYHKNRLVNSRDIKCDRLWDILTKKNKKSIILDVPLTYPAESPLNGLLVTGFLTPGFSSEKCTQPPSFKEEIKEILKEDYHFDVNVGLASYKGMGKEILIKGVYKMTEQKFQLMKYLIKNKEWNLFFSVIIGTDRLEHIFWNHFDENHRNFKKDSEFKDVIKNYYKYLDKKLGEILEILDENTTTIIVSDHGMDRMDGRFCLNDWLIKESYLKLIEIPDKPSRLDLKNVDWSKTKAFAIGAYFGRIYFNLKNREPNGIVEENEYGLLQKEIIEKLRTIPDDKGNKINNRHFVPQEIYKGNSTNESPDLYVYFDNLKWGVNNDIGNEKQYALSTTVGPDAAGHAPQGIFIMSGKNVKSKGNLGEVDILDIAPTILNRMSTEIPFGMLGKTIK